MRIPYVIDNIETRLADVLNALLQRQAGQQLDIASAYFSIRGFEQLRATLPQVRGFRLLLGDRPEAGEDVGLRADAAAWLRHELNAEPFSQATLRLVEELVRFLRRDDVSVRLFLGHDPDSPGRRRFLHAKCYLLYGGRGDQAALFDRLNPIAGIVGSSNFTGPGLLGNREVNLVHKTLLEADEIDDPQARSEVGHHAPNKVQTSISAENRRLLKSEVGARAIMDLARWYESQWQLAIDFKEPLIALLEDSKFGGREYMPYEIYMKALYEYFKDDLDGAAALPATRSAIDLAEFQEDAVRKARRILAQYDGVIVADSVGLGKTWIGKKLLEEYAYHLRQKALVICPASLKPMWENELRGASIAAQVVTQERLASAEFDLRGIADVDVILVDEAHNFRNKLTKRYMQLETILAANGRRGRDGARKKLILLTATPINNNIFDLYNQINLFTGNDRTYFASAGIGDLYKYFLAARRRLHRALQADIDSLTEIWHEIKEIGMAQDAKLQTLKRLLATELQGQKVIVFTYYKDTARYVHRALTGDASSAWRGQIGDPTIRRIDGAVKTADRLRIVERFAPVANGAPELAGSGEEVDILVATDVLSEGQNLQDCGVLVNYDLHWNPTRMVQRAGRIDRLGSSFATLTIFNMFPERALEELLGLVRSLTAKIDVINQTGFLDASVLGEVVTPRDFNTLKRIAAEDATVIDEQESFLELASSEALLAELQRVLGTEARRWLRDLDDGIHSGLQRRETKGLFFYFIAPRENGRAHFWRYYDLASRRIIDNRYQIMQIIACSPDTPRFPPPYQEVDVFDIQEKVIAGILGDVEQQAAASLVNKPVAEEQTLVAQVLQEHLNDPQYDRQELRALRRFLKQPLVGASVQQLRKALQAYGASGDVAPLIEALRDLYGQQAEAPAAEGSETRAVPRIERDDLHLVCYEYIYA